MGRRGKNTLDVAEIIVGVTKNMGTQQLERFERELVRTIPRAIIEAADVAKAQTKPKPKAGSGT
jgi:hypothetical protein